MTILTKEQYIKHQLTVLANQLPDYFYDNGRYSEILQQMAALQAELQDLQCQASIGVPSLRNQG